MDKSKSQKNIPKKSQKIMEKNEKKSDDDIDLVEEKSPKKFKHISTELMVEPISMVETYDEDDEEIIPEHVINIKSGNCKLIK